MSKPQPHSRSPIQLLNSGSKSYQTPAKYITTRNDTIYEQEYYKEKCQRLQKQNKELKQQNRVLQTQNKELKTQVQLYRQNNQRRVSPIKGSTIKDNQLLKESEEVHKLLKQIRMVKNTYEMQLNDLKGQNKRLNKKILQLQDNLHQQQVKCQQKCQSTQIKIQQKNKQIQKQLKQLRKSVVTYMQQRDQSQARLLKLKAQLESKDNQIAQINARQQLLIEQKGKIQDRLNQLLNGRDQMFSFYEGNKLSENVSNSKKQRGQDYDQNKIDSSGFRSSKLRDQLYNFGSSKLKVNKLRQSSFSIHTFNGARHVPAEQAIQVSECLHSEIHRLQSEIQRQSLLHVKQISELQYKIQRYQKQIKQKQNDLVNLLTKVKPLMLEKHKMTNTSKQSKQNQTPKKSKEKTYEEEKQTIGKNAFGLKMLQVFLKKYKMETF